ncbi:MAG: T9SS type A sorting domain-containing protein [Candidatus Kapaibacterium sp.]
MKYVIGLVLTALLCTTATAQFGKWDGKQWKSLYGEGGSAILDCSNFYRFSVVDDSGHVFISLEHYDNEVDRWDGNTWTACNTFPPYVSVPLPGGMARDSSGNVYCVYSYGDTTSKDKSNWTYNVQVMKWNKNAWEPFGRKLTQEKNYQGYGGQIGTGGILMFDRNSQLYHAWSDIILKMRNDTWDTIGTTATMQGLSIWGLTIDSKNNIYAVGSFKDREKPYYVLKYDGLTWSAVGNTGTFLPSKDTNNMHGIFSIECDEYDNLYVSSWDIKNSSGASYIAKWNGKQWSEVGDIDYFAQFKTTYGLGEIGELVVKDSKHVYAYGDASDTTEYLCMYDGEHWKILLILKGPRRGCGDLTLDKYGNLYISGDFGKPTNVKEIDTPVQNNYYPNPANTIVCTSLPYEQSIVVVRLYDLIGNLVQVNTCNTAGTQVYVDVSALKVGLYYIVVCDESGTEVSNGKVCIIH